MISPSTLPSPGGSTAFSFQAMTRLELVKVPASSAKQPVGRRKTSVWILAGSTSLSGPKFFQNSPVSVASGSITTRYFSLASAAESFFWLAESFFWLGTAARGLKPWQMKPFILPWCMRSNMAITS